MLNGQKQKRIEIWTGNQAISEAVAVCRPEVISAYPITPSTPIIQDLSDFVQSGKIDGQYIGVESEHAAMSGCVGASAAGARTFTATASQGLLYMMEMVYIAGFTRLPMTMTVVNRSLFGGWNIWLDHQDLYSMRDSGWIQLVAKNNQEAHDMIPQSFKVSEDHSVYVPSAVNIDGFVLSHVAGQVQPLEQRMVYDFLPAFEPYFKLDPESPESFGALTMPDEYTRLRIEHNDALNRSRAKLNQVMAEFSEITGRDWGKLVEIYGPDHANVGIISMGTIAEEAEEAIDLLNSKGIGSFGGTRIRSFRPFPVDEIIDAGKRYDKIIVIDRAFSFGSDSPLVTEVRNVLYKVKSDTPVVSLVMGIGGSETPYTSIVANIEKKMKEDN